MEMDIFFGNEENHSQSSSFVKALNRKDLCFWHKQFPARREFDHFASSTKKQHNSGFMVIQSPGPHT